MTNNIRNRNRAETIEAATLLWRAFCDPNPKKSMKKYLAKDAVIVFPDGGVVSKDTEPSLEEFVEDFEPWTSYRMQQDEEEVKFVEIDMMSSVLTYNVTTWQQVGDDKSRMRPTDALCTSVFRQGPGGDWQCVVHHMARI
ncbi:hypothetical protein F5X68DRAFT_249185 [Plectosphaerella plurivora]|uniref:DUF4440 domain-containing protein n=1 Tax=Plectosphaerella plurivora TaxID=936078 RepID=A0A9P8V300_9PEZI|nr:hypothetical protein F5X68DRAFT_249185 [Plectosphaerella plurivora]